MPGRSLRAKAEDDIESPTPLQDHENPKRESRKNTEQCDTIRNYGLGGNQHI